MKSRDYGATWTAVGLDGMTVKSIAVSRDGRVYAGTKPPRIYMSEDDGKSWAELKAFQNVRRFFWFSPAEAPFTAYVQAIALDGDVILAGIELGAVVRSPDRGSSFESHRPGALRDCHSLAAATGGRFFEAGGTGGGAAFSTDGGRTWRRPDGHSRHYGWAVAVDPGDPELWYFSSAPGVRAHSNDADAAIYRCRGNASCQQLAGGLPSPMDTMPYALITGPQPGSVIAGMSNGEVWASADAGDTWRFVFKMPGVNRTIIRLED